MIVQVDEAWRQRLSLDDRILCWLAMATRTLRSVCVPRYVCADTAYAARCCAQSCTRQLPLRGGKCPGVRGEARLRNGPWPALMRMRSRCLPIAAFFFAGFLKTQAESFRVPNASGIEFLRTQAQISENSGSKFLKTQVQSFERSVLQTQAPKP